MKPINGTPGGNLQVIDLVRSLSILSVLAYHLAPALNRFGDSHSWLWERISSNGPGGVFMFFVVSGFLITRIIDRGGVSLYHPDLTYFYARRVGRIIPLFLFYVFLGLAFTAIITDFIGTSPKSRYCFELPRNPWDPAFWLSLLTFTNNWVGAFYFDAWGGLGNHWSLIWSLCVEEQFYLFYPLVLMFLGNRLKAFWFFISLVLASLFLKIFLPDFGSETGAVAVRMNIASYGLIAEGILLYLACAKWNRYLTRHPWLCATMSVAGLLAVVSSYSGYLGEHWIYRDWVIGPGLFLLLLGGIHLSFFESGYFRLLALPGKVSYGSYLFHIVVLYLIHPFLVCQGPFVAFFIYAIVTTLVATVSYHLFEVPANHFVRRWLGTE
ncbi:MAG TPA: acyltransferase [bacterium]|nr:acyltransferase [bacterium]